MEQHQARKVLGLAEDFTQTQLDQAFRSRALEHHPDRGGDPIVMKRLVAARTTLTRPSVQPSGPPEPTAPTDNDAPKPSDEPMDRISFTAVSVVLLIPVAILAALVIITIVVVSSIG